MHLLEKVGAFFVLVNIYLENKQINTYLNMKKLIRLTESDLRKIVKESVKRTLKEGLWDNIVKNNYQIYDQFVNFIRNFYAIKDSQLAYQVEDDVNAWLAKMMKDLDNKYGEPDSEFDDDELDWNFDDSEYAAERGWYGF